ncbi:MAG: DNA repair protein RecN [Deltaproteobacteria bacterium]|nr:DNA repair protein RecN [Deltaproteobacteria bacterium]
MERQELLTFQSREVEATKLRLGEDEELKKERDRLVNVKKLFETTHAGYEAIYSSSGSVIERIGQIINRLKEASRVDKALIPSLEALQSSLYQLEDVANTLRDYSQGLNLDPRRLEEVDERLDVIGRLKKKYGATIQEILQEKARIDKELEGIVHRDERVEELKKRVEGLRVKAMEMADELSMGREKASKDLKKRVEEELSNLGMKKAIFDVRVERMSSKDGSPRLTEKGVDRVEFFISPNVGEEPRPLTRIASGGELSRIMLALKGIMAGRGGVPALIFDEVDSGIGGGIAEVVGRRLKTLSRGHQVLCITHLPQIAVYGDTHYLVSKGVKGERTYIKVKELKGEERVYEVSRMLGGMKITDKTMEHAREMLENAKFSRK